MQIVGHERVRDRGLVPATGRTPFGGVTSALFRTAGRRLHWGAWAKLRLRPPLAGAPHLDPVARGPYPACCGTMIGTNLVRRVLPGAPLWTGTNGPRHPAPASLSGPRLQRGRVGARDRHFTIGPWSAWCSSSTGCYRLGGDRGCARWGEKPPGDRGWGGAFVHSLIPHCSRVCDRALTASLLLYQGQAIRVPGLRSARARPRNIFGTA